MSIVGIKGALVRLVPPDRALHLENALAWMNDPETTRSLKLNLGVSRQQEERFFEHVESGRPNSFHWAILDEVELHVGFIGLVGVDWINRCASGGLVIGDRSAWGRGLASDAVRVRSRFAFDQLGLHRIDGHTVNPAMKRVYLKCGYRPEGVARQKLWREGLWHDVEFFGLLSADWAEAKGTVSERSEPRS